MDQSPAEPAPAVAHQPRGQTWLAVTNAGEDVAAVGTMVGSAATSRRMADRKETGSQGALRYRSRL